MKKLVKSLTPPSEITYADEDNTQHKFDFSSTDLVDILQQIEELKNFNIAIRIEDGHLQLAVGDSIYEISEIRDQRYPRRRLRKLET